VVLDEADRMLDIGFLPDLQRILSFLPKQRTTLLFSATFSPEIKRLASSYLQNPVIIEVARPNETASTVSQHFYSVVDDDKRRALKQLIVKNGITQAFVFVNSKLGCARLARSLEREGLKTSALHGDKSQDERLKALDAFKSGEVDLLICTDVAARGLDIKDVPAVFNFDVPYNAEDYVHRIGRTGRAGASGLAISFVSATDAKLIGDIEKLIKTKVELETVEFEDGYASRRQEGFSESRGDSRGSRDNFDSRPRRSSREGSDFSTSGSGSSAWGQRNYEKKAAPVDPFFNKPYEPSVAPEHTPSWEAATRPTTRSISANIKPKRKVAALFKTETQESS
jgi:superfamily II DNA/RNA helicase